MAKEKAASPDRSSRPVPCSPGAGGRSVGTGPYGPLHDVLEAVDFVHVEVLVGDVPVELVDIAAVVLVAVLRDRPRAAHPAVVQGVETGVGPRARITDERVPLDLVGGAAAVDHVVACVARHNVVAVTGLDGV